VKRNDKRSNCPVNSTLEIVGDSWSLLVVRDVVFHGKRTFGEFLASEERITSSVLADRLAALTNAGVLTKSTCETDRRRSTYALTEKGLALIPVLVELANWGVVYDPDVVSEPLWVEKSRDDRSGLCDLIRSTVEAGGSVFRGEGNVVEQLRLAKAAA
jgi:DNA-binding HxlR family transcriptional regulator